MKWTFFLTIFMPMLVNFITSKLILQTDLIMLAKFGESAVAAYSAPVSIMFLDTLIALALSPIIGVRISEHIKRNQANQGNLAGVDEISKTISSTLIISIILTAIGLAIYPTVTQFIVKDIAIKKLAVIFVVYMTISIVPRFMQFVFGMCLHALGRGKIIYFVSLISLPANYFLNHFFSVVLNVGPTGVYISTLAVSCATSGVLFLSLRDKIDLHYFSSQHILTWLTNVFNNTKFEFIRLSSYRLVIFITFIFISGGAGVVNRLTAYSIVTEFMMLVSMPVITLTRSLSIYLVQENIDNMSTDCLKNVLMAIGRYAIFFSLFVGFIMYVAGDYVAINLYHISNPETKQWWDIFLITFVFIYPALTICGILKATFHAKKMFSITSKVDLRSDWIVFTPIFVIGCLINEPTVVWSSYLASSIFIISFICKYLQTSVIKTV